MISQILVLSALAILIYAKGILDLRGTLVASLIGGVIIALAGYHWFSLLFLFLLLGYASTKYRFAYKETLNVAEKNRGKRSTTNVLANGLVPAVFAFLLWYTDGSKLNIPIVAGYVAAIATVTGDTLSSEIGVLSKNEPFLITSLERVPRGTDGGISVLGEAAGSLGAVLIGLAAAGLGVANLTLALPVAFVGGTFGFHFDSFMGAVFERRGLCGNATVNFLSTMAGAVVGLSLAILMNPTGYGL